MLVHGAMVDMPRTLRISMFGCAYGQSVSSDVSEISQHMDSGVVAHWVLHAPFFPQQSIEMVKSNSQQPRHPRYDTKSHQTKPIHSQTGAHATLVVALFAD